MKSLIMKLKLLLFSVLLIIFIRCSNDDDTNPDSDIQYATIPDKNFEQALIDLGIDTDGVVNRRVALPDILEVISLCKLPLIRTA